MDSQKIVAYLSQFRLNIALVVPEKLFQKGYTAKWTDEIFIIDHQIPTHPPTYKIRALNGEFHEKKFYTEELIKINHS